MAPVKSLCPSGHTADRCAELVAGLFPKGRQGDKHNRQCPFHDDRKSSLSINAGRQGMWLVWRDGGGCDPDGSRIRAEAIARGADPGCLGNYGLPKRPAVPGLRITTADPALVADAKRWNAVLKLIKLPAALSGQLMRMCIQALSEGDGDLPGDPYELLPVNRDDFLALAKRAGIERGYAYRVYRQWLTSEGA